MEENHRDYHIDPTHRPDCVKLRALRTATGANNRPLINYWVYANGNVYNSRTGVQKKASKSPNSTKTNIHLSYQNSTETSNPTVKVCLDEIVITSFYPNLPIPQQIVHLNGNEQDCSLKNLVPLWTQEEMVAYWILRLKEEKQMDIKVADFQVCNRVSQDYLLTEAGEIFSIRRQRWPLCSFSGAYRVFNLAIENHKTKTVLLHRLVCYTYKGPPPSATECVVDHIDRDTENNHHSNLRWVNYSTNNLNRGEAKKSEVLKDEKITEWRTVGIFDGKDFTNYEVNEMGMLRNAKKQMMFEVTNEHGYVYNKLTCSSTNNQYGVLRHRLVAWSFLNEQRSDIKNTVDHINGVKNDNRVVNLRWVSQKANVEFGNGQTIIVKQNNIIVNTFPTVNQYKDRYKDEFPNLLQKLRVDGSHTFISRVDGLAYTVERKNTIKKITQGLKLSN